MTQLLDGSATVLRFARGQTPLGNILIAWTEQGLCALRLLLDNDRDDPFRNLAPHHPGAELREDAAGGRDLLDRINDVLAGRLDPSSVPLDLPGTPFQQKVWHELLRLPCGETCSYTELARRVGRPQAVRAVASACARNPIGLLVPCHRVLRSDGSLGGYYWGLERKQQILDWERKLTTENAEKKAREKKKQWVGQATSS